MLNTLSWGNSYQLRKVYKEWMFLGRMFFYVSINNPTIVQELED
jgi:hypothetical protein